MKAFLLGLFVAYLSRLMPTTAGGTAASEWGVGDLLTRGTPNINTAIAAAQVISTTIDCAGDSELTVQVDMTGAANGDLIVNVRPFESDNVTALPGALLPAVRSNGPTFSAGSGAVGYTGTYDVSGIAKVQVAIQNNNAGAQTLRRFSWRLS